MFWAKPPLRDALAPEEAGFSTLLVAQRRWLLNVKIAVSLPRAGAAREEEANRSKGCHPEDPDPERNEGEGTKDLLFALNPSRAPNNGVDRTCEQALPV